MLKTLLAAFTLLGSLMPANDAVAAGLPTRLIADFSLWTATHHVPDASMVVFDGDEIVARFSKGNRTDKTRVPVGSLSKAITGVCVARLVEAGKLSYDDRIGSLLADYLKANPPRDKRVPDLTVAQLLTHTTGLTYDPSQGDLFAHLDLSKENLAAQLSEVFSRRLGEKPGKSYFYNNLNYTALSMIIENVTHETYETACRRLVLRPLGITRARLMPKLRILAGAGSWEMSAEDFGRFTAYFRPASRLLHTHLEDWPAVDTGNGIVYSIGTIAYQQAPWQIFWHFGQIELSTENLDVHTGAVFINWSNRYRVVATYRASPPDSALVELFNSFDAEVR